MPIIIGENNNGNSYYCSFLNAFIDGMSVFAISMSNNIIFNSDRSRSVYNAVTFTAISYGVFSFVRNRLQDNDSEHPRNVDIVNQELYHNVLQTYQL
jgi:hypothetical protein